MIILINERLDLRNITRHKDQTFVPRTFFNGKNSFDSLDRKGETAQTKYRFGGIGDDTVLLHKVNGTLDLKIVDVGQMIQLVATVLVYGFMANFTHLACSCVGFNHKILTIYKFSLLKYSLFTNLSLHNVKLIFIATYRPVLQSRFGILIMLVLIGRSYETKQI